MKRNIVKFLKSKYSSLTINDSLGSISEPATSTSTADPASVLSVSTGAAAASAQVTQVAGVTAINEHNVSIPVTSVTLSVQLRPSYPLHLIIIINRSPIT
jgi:hypothetical protein